ncbi:hypothetical protein HPB52_003076 [Rhipicephalus sanguineus]|uniref:Acyl-coa synthetase n=1 Tax=Rhipicephalus sanguineus TaxID=34632 RepID=A0A9D4PQJ7_RHISA|nr:hypothetical protein HPB52_003076 [Rhipicephalus sanguineus]
MYSQVSALSTVPYLARCLLDHPQRSRYDLGHLRYLATGTSYISEDVARRLFLELNLKSYVQIYGQTEFVFITGGLHDSPPRFGSIGRLGVGVEAMVIDNETKKPLGSMQHGELVVRGPGLMRGYWGMEDQPCTDPEGWYRTGDECYLDDEGWLYLVQRMSESIHCRNVKVIPPKVEAALLQCAHVKDCAVVGLPHLQAGQVPHAIIVPKSNSRHLGPEHYVRFVNERMPEQYRLEGGVTLVDAIPRNKLGKLVRRELVNWMLERRAHQMTTIVKSSFGDCAPDFRKNFGGYILEHLRLNPNSRLINATSYDERTYGDIANQAEAVHGALESLGVCAGDRLCLMVDNRLELLPMLVGAACANVGVVCENPGYPVDVFIEWMKNIEFTAICCELSNVDSALELKARLPTIKHIIVLGEGKNMPTGAEAVVVLWSQLIKMGTKARRLSALSVEYQANRICYIAPTSGTTGKPKTVVHCHDSLVANVQSIRILSGGRHGNQGVTLRCDPDSANQVTYLVNFHLSKPQVYGKAEIAFVTGGLHNSPPRFTSIGRLGVGLEAMVIDNETKKPLGPMQHGELVVRGPGLMRGYLGMEDEPCTDPEGWYRTGDV